jgi:nicotinamidase-related amidase
MLRRVRVPSAPPFKLLKCLAFLQPSLPLSRSVIPKRTNSAFIGTGLEHRLRAYGLETLVITGVSTNNSVEATVRMAGNLGFQTYVVADACFTFARRDFHGRLRTADEVHSMSLANLHKEYCTVLDTAAVLADA